MKFHRQSVSLEQRTGKLETLLSKAAAYSNFLQGSMPVKPADEVVDDEEEEDNEDEAAEDSDTKKRKKPSLSTGAYR